MIRRLDDYMREGWANIGSSVNDARQKAIIDDLRGRMGGGSPDFDSVGASLAGHMPGGESASTYAGWLRNRNEAAREDLYRQAAAASPTMNFQPHVYGVRENLAGMMSGTGLANRAGQVGVYGGMVGGTVAGLAGLTAAGQQLMALTSHMQETQDTAMKRDMELA